MKRQLVLAGLLPLVLALGGATARAASGSDHEAEPAPQPARAEAQSTIDAHLQHAAERLLRGAKPVEGAVVALDPKTGQILAFAGFGGSGSSFDVLTQARMPAASVFKIVTTTALFEHTKITPRDRVCIKGGLHGIERRHLEPAHGPGTECGRFAWALGHSKNAVYAQLATRLLTRNNLLETGALLGFNAKLPLDGGQQEAELGKLTLPYNDLEFARAAAGFEGSKLSPIGAAYLMTLIARGGDPVALRLHDTVDSEQTAADDSEAGEAAERPFSHRTAERLTRMLEVTVETGTCRHAFTKPDGKRYLHGIKIAGKTGTLRPEDSDDTMTSWFAGFAPSRNPQIVVSVMLVNGRIYRRKANEVGRDFLRAYFHAHGHADTVSDPFEQDGSEPVASR